MHFTKLAIATSGGDVLLIRSVFNQMNPQEFRNSFYAYSPQVVRRDLLGPSMNLSDEDLLCHGSLAVFNRGLECGRIAFNQKRCDHIFSIYQRCKRALPYKLALRDDENNSYALRQFIDNLLKVLMTSIPLSWRGFWSFRALYWKGVF